MGFNPINTSIFLLALNVWPGFLHIIHRLETKVVLTYAGEDYTFLLTPTLHQLILIQNKDIKSTLFIDFSDFLITSSLIRVSIKKRNCRRWNPSNKYWASCYIANLVLKADWSTKLTNWPIAQHTDRQADKPGPRCY